MNDLDIKVAFAKGFAIGQLIELKAEIEEKESKLNFKEVPDVALKMAYIEVAKIIDEHISELKGE